MPKLSSFCPFLVAHVQPHLSCRPKGGAWSSPADTNSNQSRLMPCRNRPTRSLDRHISTLSARARHPSPISGLFPIVSQRDGENPTQTQLCPSLACSRFASLPKIILLVLDEDDLWTLFSNVSGWKEPDLINHRRGEGMAGFRGARGYLFDVDAPLALCRKLPGFPWRPDHVSSRVHSAISNLRLTGKGERAQNQSRGCSCLCLKHHCSFASCSSLPLP